MNLEKSYDRFYKKITIGASLVCFIFFGLAAVEENYLREWKTYQKEFKEILLSKAESETQRQLAEEYPVKIKQIILKDFGHVDRCITCHNGLEDPRMSDQAPPHAAHSGDYLKKHPIEKFGCSVCHGGQDRALTIRNVFAKEEGVHWENPVIPLEFVQSSCGKCHLAVFDRNQTLPGAEVLMKGRKIFYREGCLGCHNVRGTGGATGLELTDEGSKTKQEYSFANIENEHHTVENWLLEHFLNPQKVSGVSEMPPVDLPADEMNALITFVMGLYTPKFPSDYYAIDLIKEFKGDRPTYSGKEAYEQFCSVCHGNNGEGKDYRVFKASVPKLNSQDFLAVASNAMIRSSIEHGRSGRMMSAWSEPIGGLSESEISGLTNYIRSWQAQAPTFLEVKRSRADAGLGAIIFRSRCGVCHGLAGEGGIGPALNNQDFLALASDKFLYKTIVTGRENTAMRSWAQLSGTEIASLIAFLRTWQIVPSARLSSVRILGDVENGQSLFKSMCVGCHGKYGQGSVGPAILNRDFLAAAS
ncbi:MAG: c-type cytochrome, partial [bacterium]